MKKSILCCLLYACVAFRAVPAFSQELQALFLEVSGRVEIKEAGSSEWKTAEPGLFVAMNTVIATGFKSNALVSLGSSQLELCPLTMLTLEELARRDRAEKTTLYLRTGRVRARVTRPSGLPAGFTVRSPTVTASVRGTSFDFDGINLWVKDGLVLLANRNGQKVYVAQGQRSRVDEADQNRVTPPFELEAALLQPLIPALSDTGAVVVAPGTGVPAGPGTKIYIEWS
jgi:ferric-dicitrate binding protein FerR (iron transport regulator)